MMLANSVLRIPRFPRPSPNSPCPHTASLPDRSVPIPSLAQHSACPKCDRPPCPDGPFPMGLWRLILKVGLGVVYCYCRILLIIDHIFRQDNAQWPRIGQFWHHPPPARGPGPEAFLENEQIILAIIIRDNIQGNCSLGSKNRKFLMKVDSRDFQELKFDIMYSIQTNPFWMLANRQRWYRLPRREHWLSSEVDECARPGPEGQRNSTASTQVFRRTFEDEVETEWSDLKERKKKIWINEGKRARKWKDSGEEGDCFKNVILANILWS